MASLDIILNVDGGDSVLALVSNINKLESQVKKLYKAYDNGNITAREAQKEIIRLAKYNNDYAASMQRMFDTMRSDTALKQHTKGLSNLGVAMKRVAKRQLELQKAEEERAKAEERRNQKLDAAADKARRRYDPIYGATKKLEEALADLDLAQTRQGMSAEVAAKQTEHLKRDYDKFVAAIKTGNMRIIDGGNQFAVFGNAAYQAQRKTQKFASSVGQQFGYQIQDFFVQIQSGTDILVALGQQGSQLLGIFGTKGALAGAVLAIGTMVAGIGVAAYKSMLGIKDFKDSLDELTDTRDEVESFFDFISQKPEEIADKFQMAIDKVIELRKTLLEDTMSSLQDKAAENLSSARPFLKTPVGLELRPEVIAKKFDIAPGRDLIEQALGVYRGEEFAQFTREQLTLLKEYQRISKEVLNAEDPLQRLSAFEKLEKTLLDLGVSTENLPDDFKQVRSELAELALEYDQTATALDKVNARINGMDFKTGFARALEQGQIDLDELLPPTGEGRGASRQDSLQKRFEQLGTQRQYMSRAFGSEIIKAAQAGFEFEMNGITETEKLRRKLQIENDEIRQKFYERRRVANKREAEEQAKLQKESFGNAQKSFDFMQNAYRNMSRAAGSPDIIRAQTEAQANREKLHNRDVSLFTTQNQIRLNALKDISDAEIRESKRVEGVQNFISLTRVQQRRNVLDTISAAEVQEAKRVANVETFIFASKNQQRVQLFKKATEDEQALIKKRNAQILSAQRGLDTYLPLSQFQMNAKAAQQDLVDGINAAMELKEELGDAAYEALRLAGFDMSKPIDDATKEAAKLAEKLGISLQFAAKLVDIAAMGPERAKFQAKISAGLIPPQAQGDFDVEGGETPFALQQYLDYVDEKLNGKKSGKSDAQKLAEDYKKYLESLNDELEIAEELKDVHGEEYALQRDLLLLKQKYGILVTTEDEKQIEATRRRIKKIEEEKALQEELADTISSSMGDAFMSIMDGTESAKDAFRNMADFIVKELFRILVMEQMVQSVKGAIVGPAATEANGGAYIGGNRLAFANGGVVNGPTYFPMSRGRTGLMGEAGPEAIMPLRRGPNGKLGVEASGGQSVVVNQSFNFSANGDESVKRIIAQEAPKIADMTTATIMDQRRRGGAMRKAFN